MLPKNLQNLVIIFKKNTECIIRFQILLGGAKIMMKFKLFFLLLEIQQELSMNANIIIFINIICKITKKHQNFLI